MSAGRAGRVNRAQLFEIRRTRDGRPIANLSVATSETWREKATGERRERTDQSGQDRYSTEVVLQGFNSQLAMLDRAGDRAGGISMLRPILADSRKKARQP
jgi:single-stranded DNA-binding protein